MGAPEDNSSGRALSDASRAIARLSEQKASGEWSALRTSVRSDETGALRKADAIVRPDPSRRRLIIQV